MLAMFRIVVCSFSSEWMNNTYLCLVVIDGLVLLLVCRLWVYIYENTCTHMSFPDIFILKNLSFASIGITCELCTQRSFIPLSPSGSFFSTK